LLQSDTELKSFRIGGVLFFQAGKEKISQFKFKEKFMELNEQEKERIIAEEKLRMETRKDFFKENFGRGGWVGGGCHGGCHRFGFLKCLFIAAAIFAVCHFWHRPYCDGPGYYGGNAPTQQTAPPVKN
jgi:hypothetical protein